MFSRTVDASEWFFMEQHPEAMLAGHALHDRHEQHVVINGKIGFLENRCQLKLVRGHLVVARLGGDAQFERDNLQFAHEGCHALRDGTEIVVVHLLVLGRVVPHQRAARQQQVGTGGIESLIHEEILLLPTEVRRHLLDRGVEVVADLRGSHVDGMQGAEQRSLVVEGFTGVRYKNGGDDQRVVDDEDGACGVPCGVAAGLEGRADAAGGERRGVGLLLHKQFAAKLLYHAAFAVVLDKRIVLLGSALGQRLKPVGVVRHAVFCSPLLHTGSHFVSHLSVQPCTVFHNVNHFFVHVLRQVLIHLFTVEHLASIILSGALFRRFYFKRLLLECLSDNLKS